MNSHGERYFCGLANSRAGSMVERPMEGVGGKVSYSITVIGWGVRVSWQWLGRL
jgi:hypothetical protein